MLIQKQLASLSAVKLLAAGDYNREFLCAFQCVLVKLLLMFGRYLARSFTVNSETT